MAKSYTLCDLCIIVLYIIVFSTVTSVLKIWRPRPLQVDLIGPHSDYKPKPSVHVHHTDIACVCGPTRSPHATEKSTCSDFHLLWWFLWWFSPQIQITTYSCGTFHHKSKSPQIVMAVFAASPNHHKYLWWYCSRLGQRSENVKITTCAFLRVYVEAIAHK